MSAHIDKQSFLIKVVFGRAPLWVCGQKEAQLVLAGPAGFTTTENCELWAPGALAKGQEERSSRYLLGPWIRLCLCVVTPYYPHKRAQHPAPHSPVQRCPEQGLAFPKGATPPPPVTHIHKTHIHLIPATMPKYSKAFKKIQSGPIGPIRTQAENLHPYLHLLHRLLIPLLSSPCLPPLFLHDGEGWEIPFQPAFMTQSKGRVNGASVGAGR